MEKKQEEEVTDKLLQIVKYGVVVIIGVTFFALLVVWATKGFQESPVIMIITGIVGIVLILVMIIDTALKGVKNQRRMHLLENEAKYRHDEKMAKIGKEK